ncbi:hypothetical protein EV696_103255 [Permianibacter aggregans]|uniref:Uncharacterized protein n=1 Tax=Permianibacter aggregans TaxID=1510150 RepID=A0A4R6US50_9GAMM|nr:hypothetical protein EV696_103255 [Permianibacter aggregans]
MAPSPQPSPTRGEGGNRKGFEKKYFFVFSFEGSNIEKKKRGPRMRQPAAIGWRPGTTAGIAVVALLRHGCRVSAARAGILSMPERPGRSNETHLALRGVLLLPTFLARARKAGRPPGRIPAKVGVEKFSKEEYRSRKNPTIPHPCPSPSEGRRSR